MSFCDKFIIDKLLGHGAYGFVYLIRDRSNKKYVVKLFEKIKHDYTNIKNECEILKKAYTQTTNIVKCIDTYNDVIHNNKKYYGIVMEYVEGYELNKLYKCAVKENKIIPTNILLKIMLEMTKILDKLHSMDIVHRDIKLANVMFNDTNIKLIDFGFSCFTRSTYEKEIGKKVLSRNIKNLNKQAIYKGFAPLNQRCKNTIAGTRRYMAPELFNKMFVDNFNVLKASDIWSLGVMMYALANLEMPFTSNNSATLENQIRSMKHVKSHHPSSKLNEIIESCFVTYKKRPSAKDLYNMILNII